MWLSLGTFLWSVRFRSQSSISRANGDWFSQIEKHVVVSAFSVTSGRGCGGIVICHKKVQQSFLNQNLELLSPSPLPPPPQWKSPGFSPENMLLWVRSQLRLMLARASKSICFELRGSLVERKTVQFYLCNMESVPDHVYPRGTRRHLLRAFLIIWFPVVRWFLVLKHPD